MRLIERIPLTIWRWALLGLIFDNALWAVFGSWDSITRLCFAGLAVTLATLLGWTFR